jgi:tRNA-dihydrouridine synthase C
MAIVMSIGSPDSWIVLGVPAVVLAPMEGVTDPPMRTLLTRLGGFRYCVSEFIRVSQSVPGPRVFRRHVPELAAGGRTLAGAPVQVQLLGGDPERLAEAARTAIETGARAIDLNFGCPARTVNRHDGGATLLKYPERIRTIVATVRQAVPAHLPVSAKLRLGWDCGSAIHENAERAAEGGASWITIHGRTKEQGYRPPAYWGPIGAVRRRLSIPVVANGEIWSVDDFRRCREETGCEHYMLGRGALANPWLATALLQELTGRRDDTRPLPLDSPADWLPLIREFLAVMRAADRPDASILAKVKQWLGLINHSGRRPWVIELRRASSLGQLLSEFVDLAARDCSASKRAG